MSGLSTICMYCHEPIEDRPVYVASSGRSDLAHWPCARSARRARLGIPDPLELPAITRIAARLGVSIDEAREMTCREVARRMGGAS